MRMLRNTVRAVSSLFEREWKEATLIANRYEIKTLLGMGSYGISYLVYDQLMSKEVVLKRLRLHQAKTKRGIRGYVQEMDLLQSLRHPAFPTFLEEGDWNDTPFFTMQYINGKTFEQLIFQENCKYTEREAIVHGLELLQLIKTLHNQGVIHRDLRIPNIMVEDGHIKVIDFGLARRLTDRTTEKYKKGFPKDIDPQSDFFQLGHFLLFLLYSNYAPAPNQKERSWEEELVLSKETKILIRRLLFLDEPFDTAEQIEEYINQHMI